MAIFPVLPNPRWRITILKNSNGDISAASRPIYSVFGSRMRFLGVGELNGANSGLNKCNRYVGENNARGVIRMVTNLKYFLFSLFVDISFSIILVLSVLLLLLITGSVFFFGFSHQYQF